MTTTEQTTGTHSTLQATTSRQLTAPGQPIRALCRAGAIAGITASGATFAVATLADALGVSIKIAGEPIPRYAFAQLTAIATIVGVVIATVIARRAVRPRRTFVRTTLALTALSFVPDLLVDAQMATRITLMLSHVAAAAIVIPVLGSRLADSPRSVTGTA